MMWNGSGDVVGRRFCRVCGRRAVRDAFFCALRDAQRGDRCALKLNLNLFKAVGLGRFRGFFGCNSVSKFREKKYKCS